MIFGNHIWEKRSLYAEELLQLRMKMGIGASMMAGIVYFSFSIGSALLPLLALPPAVLWMWSAIRRHQSYAAMREAWEVLLDVEKTLEADILRRQGKKRSNVKPTHGSHG